MAEVVMYSSRVCPYCTMAEKLLQKKGVTNLKKILQIFFHRSSEM